MGWGAEVGRRRSLNELGGHPLRVEDGMRRSEKAEVPEETEPEVRRLWADSQYLIAHVFHYLPLPSRTALY